MAWFRRPAPDLPTFDPSEANYPFAFPVVAVLDDGTVWIHRSPERFRWCDQRAATSEDVLRFEVFAGCGRTWKPTGIVAANSAGKGPFGIPMVVALFEYDEPRTYVLEELRGKVRDAILNDPDDIWSQHATHDEVLTAVDGARTFEGLVRVIVEAGSRRIAVVMCGTLVSCVRFFARISFAPNSMGFCGRSEFVA